ncbi:S-layer family protein [Oscillatoria sp. FACHB-1407]|uniref:two-partner secretion domain-containing protein n=1 Tax=Oscillatoria sp. FACHB-1407 TaxID=2692847 RepID=UPI001683800C|nr:S-layer family protein [Oscillatoria sp. FACHB-1407]MBD2459636.1 S-layer family protein [Oscillatoria sp. FACHB-1407]
MPFIVNKLVKRSPLVTLITVGSPLFWLTTPIATAQIIPDNTLPDRSVVPANCTRCEITGGTQRGSNLFHSFEQFSVPTNGEAFFNNAFSVRNIFSRVTGTSISNIDGVIGANGSANIFLLNPNGIIFGANASLNVGGSFIATTGDRILFSDGFEFSATAPTTTPLLTVNTPVGLQLGANPGAIQVQNASLAGAAGRTLALLGGRLNLSGAEVRATQGRIELGSVATGTVALTPVDQGWEFDYSNASAFQNMVLSNGTSVDASGNRGGEIQVQGQRIQVTQGSQIRLVARTTERTGNIQVRASDRLELVGDATRPTTTGIFNEVRQAATGRGSSLTIETGQLIVRNGAQISTNTFGSGQGADLRIIANQSVDLSGSLFRGGDRLPSGLFTAVVQDTTDPAAVSATGQGGTLSLQTPRLTLSSGAQISTSTFGAGNAGNLQIAADLIELDGTVPGTNDPTAIFANVAEVPTATGNGGALTINSDRLTVTGGAQIGTTAQNTGRGGVLTINADSVVLSGTSPIAQFRGEGRSGLFVSAEPALADGTVTTADAGALFLTARHVLVEDGALISADNFGLGRGANLILNVDRLRVLNGGEVGASSLLEQGFRDRTRGPGGTVTINAAERVEVRGTTNIGGQTVNSGIFTLAEGTGAAGDIRLRTRSLSMDDRATLSAETASTQGGNITLQTNNLVMQRNSRISTSAGTSRAGGDGGNINITADFIVATPQENNDITANAFTGAGGEVNITVQTILGLTPRSRAELQALLEPDDPLDPVRLSSSDITAISQANPNLNGRVTLTTPDVDPAQGLVELPADIVDASNLIAQGCSANTASAPTASEFVITGRGGLPPSPLSDSLEPSSQLPSRWVASSTSTVVSPSGSHSTTPATAITEAEGWVIGADGQVYLTAHITNNACWQ